MTKGSDSTEEAIKEESDFKRNVERKGAVQEGSAEFYVCMKKALGTSFTVSEFKFAIGVCKPKAKTAFENAGGDANLFDALFNKQVRTKKVETLSACNRFTSDATVCKTAVLKMASLLGEKAERDERNTQDGAQEEAATVLESCRRATAANSADTCVPKAKEAFKRAGGDESKYTEEVRQGLGVIGAEIKSACYKKTDKSAKTGSDADACEKLSKEEYKAAGGAEKDFWADQKRGNYKMAIDKFKTELDAKVEEDTAMKALTDSTSVADRAKARETAKNKDTYKKAAIEAAKKYYKEELKGDEADFDDEEFEEMTKHADKKLDLKPDKKVEMQIKLQKTEVSATALAGKKKNMEDAIKEAVEKVNANKKETAIPVTVKCGNSTTRGTKTHLVCKIDAVDKTKAAKVQEYTRDDTFAAELKTKFNAKGRRLNGRYLSASLVEVESSQALTASVASTTPVHRQDPTTGTKTNTGTKSKNGSPAPASDDDEDILSMSSRTSASNMLTGVLGIVMTYFLTSFR